MKLGLSTSLKGLDTKQKIWSQSCVIRYSRTSEMTITSMLGTYSQLLAKPTFSYGDLTVFPFLTGSNTSIVMGSDGMRRVPDLCRSGIRTRKCFLVAESPKLFNAFRYFPFVMTFWKREIAWNGSMRITKRSWRSCYFKLNEYRMQNYRDPAKPEKFRGSGIGKNIGRYSS